MRTVLLWGLVAASLVVAIWLDANAREWAREAACLEAGGVYRGELCFP